VPLTENSVKLLFRRIEERSGVDRLHAHLRRHTFAITCLLNGGDIFSLQAILGHTTLEMVRHYLHFTSSQVAAQHHEYSPRDKLHQSPLWREKENLLRSKSNFAPEEGLADPVTQSLPVSIF